MYETLVVRMQTIRFIHAHTYEVCFSKCSYNVKKQKASPSWAISVGILSGST